MVDHLYHMETEYSVAPSNSVSNSFGATAASALFISKASSIIVYLLILITGRFGFADISFLKSSADSKNDPFPRYNLTLAIFPLKE